MAIGPTIENGFYYDVDLEESITEDDLAKLEKRMTELARTGYEVVKKTGTWQDAYDAFAERGETYKLQILDENIEKTDTPGFISPSRVH